MRPSSVEALFLASRGVLEAAPLSLQPDLHRLPRGRRFRSLGTCAEAITGI